MTIQEVPSGELKSALTMLMIDKVATKYAFYGYNHIPIDEQLNMGYHEYLAACTDMLIVTQDEIRQELAKRER